VDQVPPPGPSFISRVGAHTSPQTAIHKSAPFIKYFQTELKLSVTTVMKDKCPVGQERSKLRPNTALTLGRYFHAGLQRKKHAGFVLHRASRYLEILPRLRSCGNTSPPAAMTDLYYGLAQASEQGLAQDDITNRPLNQAYRSMYKACKGRKDLDMDLLDRLDRFIKERGVKWEKIKFCSTPRRQNHQPLCVIHV
jgi:hypothetical protein